jgi:hypothetical protein
MRVYAQLAWCPLSTSSNVFLGATQASKFAFVRCQAYCPYSVPLDILEQRQVIRICIWRVHRLRGCRYVDSCGKPSTALS